MKVAPIIHTRTFSCDFNSEFLVRPNDFMSADVKWARKYVLEATGEIDSLNGVRWLIADNEKYRMAGVIGFLKEICSLCQLNESDRLRSQELFCDDKGRAVYAFIGVVIDRSSGESIGDVPLEYLWYTYLEKVSPVWKRTVQDVITVGYTDINALSAHGKTPEGSVSVGAKTLFEANPIKDRELFSSILCDANMANFSFCSNIPEFNMSRKCEFTIITTTQNIITRLSRENRPAQIPVSDKDPTQDIRPINSTAPSQVPDLKKKVS